MTNVVGLQTDDAGNVGQNSSANVARVVGLQTDAVVVTETRLTWICTIFRTIQNFRAFLNWKYNDEKVMLVCVWSFRDDYVYITKCWKRKVWGIYMSILIYF